MEPVYLRQKNATGQATMYGAFATGVWALFAFIMYFQFPGWKFSLIFIPIALMLTYFAVRLATLRVRLDDRGLWEPSPFRLTYVTPWSDIRYVRKTHSPGKVNLSFIAPEIVHMDGETHEVVALKLNAGVASAEEDLDRWLDAIRSARSRALGN